VLAALELDALDVELLLDALVELVLDALVELVLDALEVLEDEEARTEVEEVPVLVPHVKTAGPGMV
jgi:hypothetical protein